MKHFSSVLLLVIPALAAPSTTIKQPRDVGCGIPAGYSFKSSAKLPDPFTSLNGTKITTKAQWPCRAQEISQLFQKYELGALPPPPTSVTATYSSGSIKVTVTDGGKSITFSAKISTPSSGKAPYPAIIGIGGISIPSQPGVATITFDNDGMAAQQNKNSHGTGLFFTLYGSSATAGATTAWAWGVSRLIDALEMTPSANIDTTRLGVSGCSRNGKGAFVVGALEPRIALTIPQESGSGGAACWRISDAQKAAGKNIQTASEIIGENSWFSPNFNTYATQTSNLPVDHHMLAGLIVPRGLFVIENDIDWLGPVSTTGCQQVGQMIYNAMGVPNNFGFSLVGGHSHCQFPSSQATDLSAAVNKYLLGGTGPTSQVSKSSVSVAPSSYIDWTAPTLT